MKKVLIEKLLLIGFLLLFIAGIFFAGRWFYVLDQNPVIRNGVTIEGVDVGDMGIADASAALYEYLDSQSEYPLVVVETDKHSATLTVGEGLVYDVESAIENAYNIGRKGNFSRNYVETLMTAMFGEDVNIKTGINPTVVMSFVEEFDTAVYRDGEDAQLVGATLNDATINVDIIPAVYAQGLDKIKLYNDIITNYNDYGLNTHVDGELIYTPPTITDDDIMDMAQPNIEFGYVPNDFAVQSALFSQLSPQINAIVIFPEEEFSLNDRLENVSQNIYNSINLPTIIMGAGLRAGLDITDRTGVISDIPLGDGQAVIIDGDNDLKMMNNTSHPVIIWIGGDDNHIYANASCMYDEGISYSGISSILQGDDLIADSVEIWRVYYSDTSRERERELLYVQPLD